MGKPRILLVDDEIHIRLIIKAYFAPYEADIVEARNGKEALSAMENENPDLLVLDYSMPIMTGRDVLSKMLEDENLRNIPVIVYTAGGFDSDTGAWLKKMSSVFLEKTNLGDDLIPTAKEILGDRLKNKA
ncbi:MAG: response regulator [Elusimicrobiota bacterium]